jgi:UDP-N-acetylglucosamine 2-epimerase
MIIDLLIRFQEETNLNYCIKLHPKDVPENYTELNPRKTMILSNRKMEEDFLTYWGILKQSLFVITGSSTSALEASLIGKPVVTIDLLNEYSDVNFIKDGLTLHCTKYGELTNHFRALSSMNFEVDSKIKEIIGRYYYRYSDENYDPAFLISEEIIKNASRNTHLNNPVNREI